MPQAVVQSAPTSPDGRFRAPGYSAAWTLRPGHVEGATCCQHSDLSNRQSRLAERIDVVFSRA
jgi:hypothetical protein